MHKQTYNIALVGATGAVGERFLEILSTRQFPVGQFYPVASSRSLGRSVLLNNTTYEIEAIDEFDFSKVDIAFFTAGGDVSKQYAQKAAAAGAIVIDNTSFFRYDDDVPLVIPEVNPNDLRHFPRRRIIANPNCSTIQMLVALKPIYDAVGITRINVATYQSISGAGKRAIDHLMNRTTEVLEAYCTDAEETAKEVKDPHEDLAFNVVPKIDVFQDNGFTREEMKMVWETHKILGDESVGVNPTAVRVPVIYGHSEAIHIETREPITPNKVVALLEASPGIQVFKNQHFPTATSHATGTDAVYVGRIRQDLSHPNGINLWVVSDNVRKGAALNAVQIAELLIQQSFSLH